MAMGGLSWFKSAVLQLLHDITPKFGELFSLVKLWAKARGINDPGQGTFNSYSLSLLVIFHLQNLSPPLLPPLAVLLEDLNDDIFLSSERECVHIGEEDLRCAMERGAAWSRRNPAGIPWEPFDLLLTFFSRLDQMFQNRRQGTSSERIGKELVVSTYEGRLIPRDIHHHKQDSLFCIEDPFAWKENTARTLHQHEVVWIIRDHVEDSLFVAAAAYGSVDAGHMALQGLFGMRSKEGGMSKEHPWVDLDRYVRADGHRYFSAVDGLALNYFSEQLPDSRGIRMEPFWPRVRERLEDAALGTLNFWRTLLDPEDAVGLDCLDIEEFSVPHDRKTKKSSNSIVRAKS